jgi:branched-chain amino acid transport system permease protein
MRTKGGRDRLDMLFREYYSLLILAGLLIILPFVLPYPALATEVVIFSLAVVAFDLCLGYAGIMMFCQASFFGTGVYATALTLVHLSQNIFVAIFAGILAATLMAFIIGLICTMRAHSYMVLLTLAFAELVYFIAYQWQSLTGGDDGLRGVIRPNVQIPGIFTIDIQTEVNFYFFVLVVFLLSFGIMKRISISPFGSILQGIRENEMRAQAIGYNTRLYKIAVFAIGGLFMGLAGSLYSMFITFAHIANVGMDLSGSIIVMELVGGMGTLFGPVVGAFVFVVTSDIASAYWDRWLLILGVLCVAFVLFARGGIWGVFRNLPGKFIGKGFFARGGLTSDEEKLIEKSPDNMGIDDM